MTDSWESMVNMGWLGLFDNSQLVDNLSTYYACIRQIRYNLQRVVDTESSFKPEERIVNVQKDLIAGAKELSKFNLEISSTILKQLKEILKLP